MASSNKPAASNLWGGRFEGMVSCTRDYLKLQLTGRIIGGVHHLMEAYNESIHFDKNLYRQDILGSIAFARANTKGGILTQAEFEKIEQGLHDVMNEWESGTFKLVSGDEDSMSLSTSSYT